MESCHLENWAPNHNHYDQYHSNHQKDSNNWDHPTPSKSLEGPILDNDNINPAFLLMITDINSRLLPPMAVAKRKLRRAGEPVRAIVGGGSKSMAKMENKARLGSGGFLGRLGFIQVLETGQWT